MNKILHLNSKNKPLAIGAIVAWVFFLMVLSSDGAETISEECLSWEANDSTPVSAESSEKIDFSNYTFDPKAVDVAEGASSGLGKGGNETTSLGFASRRSVLDIYYNNESPLLTNLPRAGFSAEASAVSSGSAVEKSDAEPAEKRVVSKKKRRMMSLIYLLACAEKQR